MTVTIDPNTGLPELPRGFRWRVGPAPDYRYVSYMGVRDHPTELSLYLDRLGDTECTGIEVDGRVHRDSSYERGPVIEKDEEIEIRGGSYEYSFFGRLKTKRVRYSRWSVFMSEKLKGNHPVAVLNSAHRLLKAKQAADVRTSIIGVYPPKKLETA